MAPTLAAQGRSDEEIVWRRALAFVEHVGAIVLALIATLTFVSVLMRYVLGAPLPDTFDFSRLMMATVIMWGIAATSYHGSHIQFEVLWEASGPRLRRIIDVLATLVTLGAMTVLTYTLGLRVYNSYTAKGTTSGLGVPLWPFQLVAWVGAILAIILLVVRTLQILSGDANQGTDEAPTPEDRA